MQYDGESFYDIIEPLARMWTTSGSNQSITIFPPRTMYLKKSVNASKPSEHPLSGEKSSKYLGGNIGSRDKNGVT